MEEHGKKGIPRRIGEWGFTLIELMLVVAIITILMTLAASSYTQSLQRAREAALKDDLFEMRRAIENYQLDKEAAPGSLQDLVDAGYLHIIPLDPITHAKDWNTENCEMILSPEQTSGGVCDVHSTSNQNSTDGTPYSEW